MFDFLVGGYLPGTNVQLSFSASLGLLAVVAMAGLIGYAEYIKRTTKSAQPKRFILHASQLHPRV